MAFRIVYRSNEQTRHRLLAAGENLVGSTNSCDIVIDHPSVSRHHATLVVTEAGDAPPTETLTVADLNSRNGTRIDDHRLRGNLKVSAGQRITFGSVEALIEAVLPDDAIAAATLDTSSSSAPSDQQQSKAAPSFEPKPTALTTAVAAHTTASVGPLSVFVLGYLPALSEALATGVSSMVLAQRAGSALLEALPCRSLSLHRLSDEQETPLFEGDADRTGEAEVTATSHGIRVRATLSDPETCALLQPLLQTVANLIRAADQVTESPRVPTQPASAPTSARPPDPLSVEPRVKELYEQALKVAPSSINVLILGESGTGKELLARYIHEASDRSEHPFVAMNCAALAQDLQEAELFGIEKGVATGVDARVGLFEQAHGGTLFLDEIGDMGLGVQAKILRVLQQQQVLPIGAANPRPADVRVLSATHRNVRAMMSEETFRSDLFHRIADFEAHLPALRERPRDITNLAIFFLERAVANRLEKPLGFSKAALNALRNFDWPGNIRQLEREVLKAALFVEDGELLDTTCLSPQVREALSKDSPLALATQVENAERRAIQLALDANEDQVQVAALELDVPTSTLYRKIKALGIIV